MKWKEKCERSEAGWLGRCGAVCYFQQKQMVSEWGSNVRDGNFLMCRLEFFGEWELKKDTNKNIASLLHVWMNGFIFFIYLFWIKMDGLDWALPNHLRFHWFLFFLFWLVSHSCLVIIGIGFFFSFFTLSYLFEIILIKIKKGDG